MNHRTHVVRRDGVSDPESADGEDDILRAVSGRSLPATRSSCAARASARRRDGLSAALRFDACSVSRSAFPRSTKARIVTLMTTAREEDVRRH